MSNMKDVFKNKNEDIKKCLAAEYVRLHNEAFKEFNKAFTSIGVKMWHDDDAHPLKPESQKFIEKYMSNAKLDAIKKVYKIVRPLTILDSYPNISKADRNKLDVECDRIFEKYKMLWDKVLSSVDND